MLRCSSTLHRQSRTTPSSSRLQVELWPCPLLWGNSDSACATSSETTFQAMPTQSQRRSPVRHKASGRLCADRSLADDHRLAADLNLFENSSTARERNVNTTWAAHPDALQAHEPRRSLGRYSLVLEQICAQRSTGGASGGILRNAEAGREHSTVHRGIIIGRLGGEYENRVLFEIQRPE